MQLLYVFMFQVLLCRRFQITTLRVLLDHDITKLATILNELRLEDNLEIDYLLLPATAIHQRHSIIDWLSVTSVFSSQTSCNNHVNIWTKDGQVCTCKLENALVYTPHNGHFYITTGRMELDGNSLLKLRDGRDTTYKKYYKDKYAIIC